MWAAIAGLAVVLFAITLLVGLSPILGVAIFLLLLPGVLLVLRREPGEPGSEPEPAQETSASGGKPSWLRKHWWE